MTVDQFFYMLAGVSFGFTLGLWLYRRPGFTQISKQTLEWWRELVDLNPNDLKPRLDLAIKRAAE